MMGGWFLRARILRDGVLDSGDLIMPLSTTTASKIDAEKILSSMQLGCHYAMSVLAANSNVPLSRMAPAIRQLVDAGRIVVRMNRNRYSYSLPAVVDMQSLAELSPRMSTQLTGYDQQMRRFAALCMLAHAPLTPIQSGNATGKQQSNRARTKAR
ncbi:hypothetical protein [Burkholderia sp. LMG 32019]|uniref:hypothetical protein n=1 Tax=Burkholderia sp. LMG 32019 TaxID=3158173 RepID=UPI003C2BDDA7